MSGSSGSHGRRASSRPLSRPLALPAAVAAAAACAAAAPPAAHAGLPVGRIDASRAIADEPKISARLRMPGYRGRIGIERRGQSSQMFPKQSYALELRDAEGEDRTAPLLGMPADGDWVLYAPYNDKTLVRNVLAYETARWTGRYAARTRLVELRLDGGYHRVYVLMEKLELGDDRVQGVALFELPSVPGALEGAVVPDAGHAAADRLGGPGAPRPLAGARRCAGGRGPGRRARAVPAGSWRRRIGEPSAVDFALVNELFKNEDGFHASTYMALRGGKLHLGPVWDFDISTATPTTGRAAASAAGCSRSATELSGCTATPASRAGWRSAEAELPPLAGARPAGVAEPGRARQLPRRAALPARVAGAPHRVDRPQRRASLTRTASFRSGARWCL